MHHFRSKPTTPFTEWYKQLTSLASQAGQFELIGEPHMHYESWARNWTAHRELNRLAEMAG